MDTNTNETLDWNNSVYCCPAAGHIITGNLKTIPDSTIRNMISKRPKYRFPSNTNLKKSWEEVAAALNEFGNRWCKQEYVENAAFKV